MIHDADRHTRAEAAYHEACEEMRDHREDYVRLYLMAVSRRLTEIKCEIHETLVRINYPHDGSISDFAPDALAALPTLDELLNVDRIRDFTRRELRKLGIYDEDAISDVAGEEYRIY